MRLFGTHPWENSVCARNEIYSLEGSSTVHRRPELLTKSSPLTPTGLAILSPAWPLFSWEIRTETWNLTWLRLPASVFCTTDEIEIGILLFCSSSLLVKVQQILFKEKGFIGYSWLEHVRANTRACAHTHTRSEGAEVGVHCWKCCISVFDACLKT